MLDEDSDTESAVASALEVNLSSTLSTGGSANTTLLTCMVFSGRGGFTMLCLLGVATVAGFVGIYVYMRYIKQTERRHPKVFLLDLSKILIATGLAAAVNYTCTAKVARAAAHVRARGKPLEGIGWYAALCTMDVVIGAPASIIIGRLINKTCRRMLKRLTPRSAWWDLCRQNLIYGKYSPEYDPEQFYTDASPPIRLSWWYAQTVTWTCASVLGVFLSGMSVLGSFAAVKSAHNPVAWMAVGVTYWNVNCLVKQWVVVAFTRVFLYYIHLEVVDFFNKYTSPPKGSALEVAASAPSPKLAAPPSSTQFLLPRQRD